MQMQMRMIRLLIKVTAIENCLQVESKIKPAVNAGFMINYF